jgi:hypothetical protein
MGRRCGKRGRYRNGAQSANDRLVQMTSSP